MADTFIVIGTGPAVNVVLGGAGASAYQIWLDAGNTGTEADFLESLEGAQGPQGATGATGATGAQGPPGDAGASDALGSGFTGGGGTGTIPAATATVGETQILFGIDDPNQFKVINSPSSDPGATAFIEVLNGVINFYANLGSEDRSVKMDAVAGAMNFEARNSDMNFSASRSLANLNFLSTPGNLTFSNPDGNVKFSDNRDEEARFGIEYAAEYPDILTNDRSIPDVGTVNLLKQTPVSYTNAAAPNNTIFYSTTDSKLSYKDPAGVVHNLY